MFNASLWRKSYVHNDPNISVGHLGHDDPLGQGDLQLVVASGLAGILEQQGTHTSLHLLAFQLGHAPALQAFSVLGLDR